jgi:hypothetical protein
VVPIIGAQYQESDFSAREVLLVADLLIGGDEEFEASVFGCREQRTVFHAGPALKPNADNQVVFD